MNHLYAEIDVKLMMNEITEFQYNSDSKIGKEEFQYNSVG